MFGFIDGYSVTKTREKLTKEITKEVTKKVTKELKTELTKELKTKLTKELKADFDKKLKQELINKDIENEIEIQKLKEEINRLKNNSN